ncbi:hypothetical protein E2542_SST21754 [Spatholobus suberectus]|nr:hypothetical protein E2542_SST21754 [Spatholobus suberectus]
MRAAAGHAKPFAFPPLRAITAKWISLSHRLPSRCTALRRRRALASPPLPCARVARFAVDLTTPPVAAVASTDIGPFFPLLRGDKDFVNLINSASHHSGTEDAS